MKAYSPTSSTTNTGSGEPNVHAREYELRTDLESDENEVAHSPTSFTTNTVLADETDSSVHANEYELRITDSESDKNEVEVKDEEDEITDPFN